jgi:prevent-host-death family protein
VELGAAYARRLASPARALELARWYADDLASVFQSRAVARRNGKRFDPFAQMLEFPMKPRMDLAPTGLRRGALLLTASPRGQPLRHARRANALGGPRRPAASGALAHRTCHDYHLVMKSVGIAELKARLSEYLRGVRRGHPVTILDRSTPIARIVPIRETREELAIRRPARGTPGPARVPMPPPLRLAVDVVELLLEERRAEG